LVVDLDEGAEGIDVSVLSSDQSSVPVLVLVDEGALSVVTDLVSEGVLCVTAGSGLLSCQLLLEGTTLLLLASQTLGLSGGLTGSLLLFLGLLSWWVQLLMLCNRRSSLEMLRSAILRHCLDKRRTIW